MYKVFPVAGGFDVFRLEPDKEPVLVPHTNKTGQVVPYKHRQAAYRRCKKLNDAVKEVDKMIAEKGAIIV
jgi:hypothetical protein